jgi:hypothetical protein
VSTPSPVDDTPRTPPPAGGPGSGGQSPSDPRSDGPAGTGPEGKGPDGTGPDGTGPEKPTGPQRAVVRYSLALTGLLAGAILFSMLSLPLVMLSGVLAVAAMICAVICLIVGIRAGQVPQAIVTGVIGLIVGGYVFVSAVSSAFIWDIRADYEECISDAITEQTRALCQEDYNSQIGDWFENLTGQPLPGSPAG